MVTQSALQGNSNGALDWEAANQQILDAIDISAECEAWRVRFSSDHVSPAGWRACHAIDREDKNPSAAVNVGGSGGIRGRYKDAASGLSLSFWDLAVKIGHFADWKEVRRHFAKKHGLKMPEGAEPKKAADDILFTPWVLAVASKWCEAKGGPPGTHTLSRQSLEEMGARLGSYPASIRPEWQQEIIAIPAYMPGRTDEEPRCWVMLADDGGDIRKFQGKDKPPLPVKTLCTSNPSPGFLNRYAVERLEKAEFVWWCEGVTDMVSAHGCIPPEERDRHVAITNAFGCQEAVHPDWLKALAGKTVYLVADADQPGQIGAAKKLAYLLPVVKEVRILTPPYKIAEKHGEDFRDAVRDWLAGKIEPEFAGTRDLAGVWGYMLRMAAAASPMVSSANMAQTPSQAALAMANPQAPPPAGQMDPYHEERYALDLLKLHVLGHYPDGSVDIYSRSRRQVYRIANVSRFRYAELLLYCADTARDHVWDGRGTIPGKLSLDQVRNAIAVFAGQTSLVDARRLGRGIWDAGGEIVIINGGLAALLQGGKLVSVTTPKVNGHVLDVTAAEEWVDFAVLQQYLDCAQAPAWCQAVIAQLIALLDKWHWQTPHDATIAACLAAATWIQTLWRVRPEVAVAGATGSGKTTLHDSLLKHLFGTLAMAFNKPTEAAIRNFVGNKATVILVDEFKNDCRRQAVLDLFRLSTMGATQMKGSSDQRGRSFVLRHIPWISEIDMELPEEADQNRFVRLEVMPPDVGNMKPLDLPPPPQITDLGVKLLAVSLSHYQRARVIFDALSARTLPGIQMRTMQCYALPMAMFSAVHSLDVDAAYRRLAEWLRPMTSRPIETDEMSALNEILRSVPWLDKGRIAVSRVLSDPPKYDGDVLDELEDKGIALTAGKVGRKTPHNLTHVFLYPEAVADHLLNPRSRWNAKNLKSVLRRLRVNGAPVAEYTRLTIARKRQYGILIPLSVIDLDVAGRPGQAPTPAAAAAADFAQVPDGPFNDV